MIPSTRATLQVTSAFLGTFREKIWPGPEKFKHVPKTAKIEGYNSRFRTFPDRARATDTTECLLEIWEVIENDSCALEQICGCLYVHFESILGFTINEQMRCSEAFQSI